MHDGLIRQRATRILQGAGEVRNLGERARVWGRRVFFVTDPGVCEAGHVEPVLASLRKAGLEVRLFDEVHPNPTTRDVTVCAEAAADEGVELIVGFGGGSSMDTAKGANFLLSNGGDIRDYRGHRKNEKDLLPMIAVPTTTGTGSEAQRFAVLAVEETDMKMACGDPTCAPRLSVLDPDLVKTQPQTVAALTGVDAMSHAIETMVTTVRNPVSLSHSREAWRLIDTHLPAVLRGEATDADWAAMQWASCLAGMAIETSMLGAAHAAANPITAAHGIAHGQAVGVMLPPVMRLNGMDAAMVERVEEFLELAGLERRLTALGVREEEIEGMAMSAMDQITGKFNPVPVGLEEFVGLYQAVLG